MKSITFFSPRLAVATLAVCVSVSPGIAGSSSAPGVPNFHVVNDKVLRGGQPDKPGFQSLSAWGVHTILDLRESGERSIDENKLVTALGMRYVNVPMRGMATPTKDQITRALAVLNDPQAGPVFIHCRRGADRTGAIVACYRISHDNWGNQQALAEARGYGMSVFQVQIKSFVARYQPYGAPAQVAGQLPPVIARAPLAP